MLCKRLYIVLGRLNDAVAVLLINDNCKTCTSEYSKRLPPAAGECTKFVFGQGSARDPAGELTALQQTL